MKRLRYETDRMKQEFFLVGEKVLVAINADENEYTAYFDTECADALNIITGKKEDLSGKIVLPPYSFRFYRCM
jgi:cyclomaltodextrinase / maltogenic alpha-amylase / neopullulanase